ncbi:YgdI/YgdR family lipoprotein [Flavilitoribacter nigricans]|uniref:Uncharacterized protein n=1 Tax=Flavilitoribacter nigricans (strain ATCC 23147 / DSM 23189 / NBRC 102662 / NCIMB 1420 / SS-2) TaxID=1122177 RepID=A0A2D0NF38_FLAN2|nr:hypothetical protein [Flavilitoribacter nigricans]PHN06976.1 hypothetical protein CRP01_08425 [Flavilitoribacter nigricans DSM 23189 = NBRC 102662]
MKTLMTFALLLGAALFLQAQRFSPSFIRFSKKQTAYLTLEDGTELQGNIKDYDWKKGLLKKIKFEDLNGNKVKMKPDQIKHLYVMPSGFAKFSAGMEFLTDAKQWDGSNDLDKDIIGKGYVYLEKTPVRIGKKTHELIMQLANPTVAGRVRVYHDPIAKETTSLGIGGVDLVGGDKKSYYLKLGTDTAFRLKKKHYEDEFNLIYKGCPEMIEKYGDNPRWADFEKHIYEYAEICK